MRPPRCSNLQNIIQKTTHSYFIHNFVALKMEMKMQKRKSEMDRKNFPKFLTVGSWELRNWEFGNYCRQYDTFSITVLFISRETGSVVYGMATVYGSLLVMVMGWLINIGLGLRL